jgi:hypothetical protein
VDKGELLLRVSFHPSGRFTLVERSGGPAEDVQTGDLLGNDDEASFYRAVAQHLALRASEGWKVRYEDTDVDKEG